MKKLLTILLFFFSFAFGSTSLEAKIQFMNTSVEKAKQIAVNQGKPLLVVFHTGWSYDFQRMENTTFADPDLSSQINERFVCVKIDLEKNIHGTKYKAGYNVTDLPTLITFHKNGNPKARKEGFIDANLLGQWLGLQGGSTLSAKSPTEHSQTGGVKGRGNAITMSIPNPYRDGFSVQLGVFNSQANAKAKAQEVMEKMNDNKEAFVVTDPRNRSRYKLMYGYFRNASQAKSFLDRASLEGYSGIVKHLQEFF